MWSVVLKILSILGIILLVLLGIVLAAVLAVLFMPVVYRGSGSAHAGEYQVLFRFRWFFGLVRGEYTYPKDGALRIKALWLTLFDSGAQQGDDEESKEAPDGSTKTAEPAQDNTGNADTAEPAQGNTGNAKKAEPAQDNTGNADTAESQPPHTATETAAAPEPEQSSKEPLSAKWKALKEKIQPYLAVVRSEDNQALVRHALGHLGRLLKSIRPRVLHLEAVIGLGEPDMTGYVYGACWAVKPFLGRKCRIAITPDFERKVLEGDVFLRGHIMGVVLLHHIIRVILDKRLWQLIDQLKKI